MRLILHALGWHLDVEIGPTEAAEQVDGAELAGGTTSAYPLGFVPSPGDQRWESGVDC